MAGEIHRSKVGTYHPAPQCQHTKFWSEPVIPNEDGSASKCQECGGYANVFDNSAQWIIHDSRGTIDGGPACDECGACGCDGGYYPDGHDCIGLSFAFVCLDGGETLCPECAEKAGITIVECDCHE